MAADPFAQIKAINQTAAFNRWAGFEVISAGNGEAELGLKWRDDFGQYNGFLHAGMLGALVDTACGFAAASIAGFVLASHYSVNCLAPAKGSEFIAKARVTKAGRRQVFTTAEVFVVEAGERKLVATGETILIPVEAK
jgi:uncharacterized protein (TIGR00369 family)